MQAVTPGQYHPATRYGTTSCHGTTIANLSDALVIYPVSFVAAACAAVCWFQPMNMHCNLQAACKERVSGSATS